MKTKPSKTKNKIVPIQGEWIDIKIRLPELTSFEDWLDVGDNAKNETDYVDSKGMNISEMVFLCIEREGKICVTLGYYTLSTEWETAENDFGHNGEDIELVPTHWMPMPEGLLLELISTEDEDALPERTEKGYEYEEEGEESWVEWESKRVLVGVRQYTGGKSYDYLRIGIYQTDTWMVADSWISNYCTGSDKYGETIFGWMPLPEVPIIETALKS